MSVTPDVAFQAFATEGGMAGPTAMDYLVKNIGAAPLNWTADSTEAWGVISPVSGVLAPEEEVVVRLTLDQSVVQALPPSIITGSIDFDNLDNDAGSTSRGLNLTVNIAPRPMLRVTPDEDFETSGTNGGPFTPTTKAYTIINDGSVPLNWIVQPGSMAIRFDRVEGMLAPGAQQVVTASVNQASASLLNLGDYFSSFTFGVVGDSSPPIVRTLAAHVLPFGPGTTSTTLSQYGITWTFDQPYEVGQFASSDWWVKGPVQIIGIKPASDSLQNRRSNGSMLNPSALNGTSQGYDSSAYAQYTSLGTYQDRLNVGLNVSSSTPLSVPAGSSLVTSRSLATPQLRPQLAAAAILTVVAEAPSPGSFRPAYSALDKSIQFNESQLDYSKLSKLAKPPITPDLSAVERNFRHPWIDHVPLWVGRYLHPAENMPDYGREMADEIGTATLMLNLDFSDAEKRNLLVRVVQLGIDLYGIFERGGKKAWLPSGGHMSGRKWPILFAGLVLNDAAMMSVGLDPAAEFGEDGQTFYVAETSPGIFNFGQGGYSAANVGLPEWGQFHSTRPSFDSRSWLKDPYRLCCTANVWWGQALSAHIMGARDLWNHEAFFDYQDRFLSENLARGIQDFRLAWTRFPLAMWTAYRGNY